MPFRTDFELFQNNSGIPVLILTVKFLQVTLRFWIVGMMFGLIGVAFALL